MRRGFTISHQRSYTIEIPSMKKKCDAGEGVNATTCEGCTQQEKDACYVDATWLQCKEESEGNFALPEMATLSMEDPSKPVSLSVQCVAECPGAASEALRSSNTTESDGKPVNFIVCVILRFFARPHRGWPDLRALGPDPLPPQSS